MRVITNILLFLSLSTGAIGQTNLVEYEHWFDGDHASASTVAVAPSTSVDINTNIDASALTDGLHVFNVRLKDESGAYSSVLSKFFLKSANALPPSAVNLVAQEYWFDNDFSGVVSSAITPSQSYSMMGSVDASSLTDGLHSVHFRFKDDNGLYSAVLSKFFLKVSNLVVSPTVELTHYEFWFDDNYAGAVSNAITPSQGYLLIDDLDASILTNGLHTMNIRFKDNTGKWSSVLSKFFFKRGSQTTTPVFLTEYQYWFDNDFASALNTGLGGNPSEFVSTDLDASALSDGLHVMNLRFKDNTGKWSAVMSKFFLKTAPVSPIVAEIDAYRWWIDSDFASHTLETLAVPVNPHLLQTNLDFTMIPHGIHEIHFQFKDVSGKWSSVLSDTIEKISLPVADFGVQNTMVCIGDQVVFLNSSVDGDVYNWDFGDNTSSTDSSATHVYMTPGVYDVSLTVSDTTTFQDSTITLSSVITVGGFATPDLSVSGIQEICDGDSITITAESGYNYLWNTNENTQSISTNMGGDYFVTITDQLNPACFTLSDTVVVVVNALPLVDLGPDINGCDGDVLTLDAGNVGASYVWNTMNTSQTLDVTTTGNYSVEVTDTNGCSASDTVLVTIHPLPTVDLGADIAQENPPAVLDAGSGFTDYLWSTSESNQTINVNSNGTYWVTVTDMNGCSASDTIHVTFTAGVNALNPIQVSVFPNPALDQLNIEVNGGNTMIDFEVIDMNGKRLHAGSLMKLVTQMDVSQLTPGTYFVRFNTGNQIKTVQFIKR